MSIVIDSSITLAWVYSDETTEAVSEVFRRVVDVGAWVPSLWRLEVANVLEMGVRRCRHDAKFRDETLADLGVLSINTDPETNAQAWGATLRLASQHKLTLYDAAYLEMALRKGMPLATLDKDLCAAAVLEGVIVLGG